MVLGPKSSTDFIDIFLNTFAQSFYRTIRLIEKINTCPEKRFPGRLLRLCVLL